MKMSDRQIRIVNAFLREQTANLEDLPRTEKTELVTRVRRQLRDELARRTDRPLQDEELIRLLNRIQFPDRAARADAAVKAQRGPAAGSNSAATAVMPQRAAVMSAPEFAEAQPARVSQPAVRTNGPPARAPGATADRKPAQTLPFGPLASSQRIWLGACTALADRFGIPADRVRIGFVVLGALTGPAALVAYLGWYWACYLDEHGPGAPRIDRSRLLRSIGETAAALASIAVVFAAAIWLVDRGHILIAGYPPDLAGSGAFAANFGAMIFVAAVITVPLSVLAGLPVAPPWDLTIPKSLRIVLGAFAALASLAFASYLSGAIVSLVQEWPA